MITKNIVVPKAWDDIYKQVKEQYPDALMAGGCLRDLENHRPVKDIDIFVCVPKVRDNRDWDSFETGTIFNPVTIKGYTPNEAAVETSFAPDNTIKAATVYESADGLPVNIIYVHSDIEPRDRLDNFDFGFNKIGYDGNTVFAHTDYSDDVLHRRMTLRRIENSEQVIKSLQRAQKFQEKYHKWNVVIPGELVGRFNELLGFNKKAIPDDIAF